MVTRQRHVNQPLHSAPPIHPQGEMMNYVQPLTEFFDKADEIVGNHDDIGELNALRNTNLLGGIFQDFEKTFLATTQTNRQ